MTLTRNFLHERFGDLWRVHNKEFLTLLIECRRFFDGDMDQVLILTLVGDRMLTPDRFTGLTYEDFSEGRRGVGKPRPINTQSIADCTGIPRETVRRKVRLLMDRGWLRRRDDGCLEVTDRAAIDLRPVTEVTFDYLLAVGRVLVSGVETRGSTRREPRCDEGA